jgi:RND family efflux transporter MFP subunit
MKQIKWYSIFSFLILLISIEIYIIYNKNNTILYTFFYNILHQKKLQIPINNEKLSKQQDEIVFVELFTVEEESKKITFDTYGQITGAHESMISFEIPGKIKYLLSSKKVQKDDVLITLDTAIEESELRGLEFLLDIKNKKLKRVTKLNKSGLYSISEVEQLEAEIVDIKIRIEQNHLKIQQKIIKAPCDGYTIFNASVAEGAMISSRQQLGLFISEKKIVTCLLPQIYLPYMREGETLQAFFFPEFNEQLEPIKGEIKVCLEDIKPLANTHEHKNSLCEIYVRLNDNNLPPYYLNETGKIYIIFNKYESYILVPEIAIVYYNTKTYVYVVQDSHAIFQEVEIIAPAENGFVKIKNTSLNKGTIIILRGLNKIYHMCKVQAIYEK